MKIFWKNYWLLCKQAPYFVYKDMREDGMSLPVSILGFIVVLVATPFLPIFIEECRQELKKEDGVDYVSH